MADSWDLDDVPPARPMTPPQRIGHYEVVQELGRGAFGTVLRARDPKLGREVAIKLLASRATERRQRDRFLREAQVTAGLRHPGIVAVHDAGELEGRPWIAYELVDGSTLEDALAGSPRREQLRLLEDTAVALGAAHAEGVVHRDVKPANVLVDETGRVRVADFGLASARQVERLTVTGELLGTPAYMAPEQLKGDRDAVGPAADVWALGVILYEVLTGEAPFVATTLVEFLGRVVSQEPRPPRSIDPSVSAALEAFCLRALSKEPTERPPDGAAFAHGLREAQRSEGGSARGPRLVAGAALVLLAGGLALVGRRGEEAPSSDPVEAVASVEPAAPAPEQGRGLGELELAAETGDDAARLELGLRLVEEERFAQADRWLDPIHAQVPAGLQFSLGYGLEKERPVDARRWLERSHRGGSVRGSVRLGRQLLLGEGGPADPDRGVDLLKAAAEGEPAAAEILGTAFLRGHGVDQDSALAEGFLRQAADAGRAESAAHLANLYLEGAPGVPPNREEALIWFKKASDAGLLGATTYLGALLLEGPPEGHAEGIGLLERSAALGGDGWGAEQLGKAYYMGRGVERDVERAAALYAQSAAAGHPSGTFRHACLLEAGVGQPADPAAAEALFEDLASRSTPQFLLAFAGHCDRGSGLPKAPSRATWCLRKAAEAGDPGAAYRLAQRLRRGTRPSRETEAFPWLLRAAEAGHGNARRLVAEGYALGRGVGEDFPRALELLSKDGSGCYALAMRFFNGQDAPRNPARGEALMRTGAEAGNESCMVVLGDTLLDRWSATDEAARPERCEGIDWWERALAKNNSLWAQSLLAQALYSGRGCEADPERAVRMFEEASERGSFESAFNLACVLEDGGVVSRDLPRARRLFQVALEGTRTEGGRLHDMARRSEVGEGVPKNVARAEVWYRRAAEAGSKPAARALERLLHRGAGIARDPEDLGE